MAKRKVKISVIGVEEYVAAMEKAAEATRDLAAARKEAMPYPELSEQIEIVYGAPDDSTRILVNGQDITGWVAVDSDLTIHRRPNEEPKLTLTLVAPKITHRMAD